MSDKEKLEQKKTLIKIGIYLGAFLIILLILRISNSTKKTDNKDNNVINNQTEELKVITDLKNISNENYEETIYLSMDDDAITLEFQKVNDILVGTKKYHGEVITFIKNNDKYYQVSEEFGELTELKNFILFDYDMTFINIDNIKKVLDKDKTPVYTEGKVTYKVNNKDLIFIYNNYNNTSYIDFGSGTTIVEVYYTNNTLDYILIDVTSLYNKIYERELNGVKYKITIKQTDEEDTSYLLEMLK